MRTSVRRAVCRLAVAGALVAGCIKLKEQVTVFPDGSGKITVSLTIPVSEKLGAVDWPETEQSVTERAAAMAQGFVAITDVTIVRHEKEMTSTFTAWFENVNDLRLGRESDSTTATTFEWTRDGDGFALVVVPGAVVKLAKGRVKQFDDLEKLPPEQKEMARKLADAGDAVFVGFEERTEVRLPGPVQSLEGFTRLDDRTVGLGLGEADLRDAAKMRAFAAATFRAHCGPSVMSGPEIESFRADLAKAKAGWAANPASRGVATEPGLEFPIEKREHVATFLPGSRIATFSYDDGTVRVRDASGKVLSSFSMGEHYPLGPVATDDGKRLIAVSSADHSVAAFDPTNGSKAWELTAPETPDRDEWWRVAALRGGLVVVAKESRTIDVIDGTNGKLIRTLPGVWDVGEPVAASRPGAFVVVEARSRVSLVDATSGARVWSVDATRAGTAARAFAVECGRDGGPVLCFFGDKSARDLVALDSATGRESWRLPSGRPSVTVSPSGHYALLRWTQRPMLVDLANGRDLGRLRPPCTSDLVFFGADDRTLWVPPVLDDHPVLRSFRLRLPDDHAPPPK